jgi:iron complex outermembrane recepter protein
MMKRLGLIMVLALCWLVFGVKEASAEEDSKVYQLEDVVITATKTPRTPGNITQKVNIVSEEEIRNRVVGKGNIAEILSYEPGNFAGVLSRNDANWGSSGGLAQKYKSYLLDGLPIDSFVDPQSLELWAFERIEDQRGPAAVLYPNYLFMDFAGNQSALAGTTNLILKEFISEPKSEIEAYYGSYDTYGARFFHQQRTENLHLFFGGHHESSDYTDYGTKNSWLNMIEDPEYEKTKLYLRGTYFINDSLDHKVNFFAHRTWHDGDTGRPNRDFDHEYTTVQAGYSFPLSNIMMGSIKLGYRKYERTWEEDNFPTDLSLRSEDSVDQEIIPGDVSFSIAHLQDSRLTFGTDFQFANYKTFSEAATKEPGNDADAHQYGLYAQEELVFDGLTLRLGGRYNYIKHEIDLLGGQPPGESSESWDKFLWSAGARYSLTNTFSVYSNVGTSFLAPSLKSVGGTIKLSDKGIIGKDGHLPNPGLEPEEGLGVDLGFDFQMTPEIYFGIRGFYNKIDDQIIQIVVHDNPSQSQDINAAETKSYGLEAEIRHKPINWMEWFANYTYTNSEIKNSMDSDQDGSEVPFVPEHMGNIGMHFKCPYEFTASVYVQLVGKIYDDTSKQNRREFSSYELLNAKAEKLLVNRDDMLLSLYLDLYNIGNKKFNMPWQFQDPGFSATGGVRLVF